MERPEFTDWLLFKSDDYKPNVKKGVILEVGPGDVGISNFSEEVFKSLKNGAVYVTIDYFRDCLPSVHTVGDCVVGDLIDLPFKNGSIDQAWLMNVFGAGDRRRRDADYHSYELWDLFFSELARVLKPGGSAIIGEYNTPAVELLGKNIDPLGYDVSKLGFETEIFM